MRGPPVKTPKQTRSLSLLALAALAGAGIALPLGRSALSQDPHDDVGYDDTPFLPGQQWRVHDGKRPQPRVVSPGERGGPPSDASVLFDGSDLAAWKSDAGDAGWLVQDGYAEVNGTGSITTRESFGDCQLHLEFATPAEVKGSSQGRGNSGVYFMSRFEVQILDSFQNPTYPDGQASALYGQYPPLVNASRGPGEWQSYDIIFHAARGLRLPGEQTIAIESPATVTVFHNGVLVHEKKAFIGATAHRSVASYGGLPERGPIQLQDHGNPIRFRNIWVRELTPYDG